MQGSRFEAALPFGRHPRLNCGAVDHVPLKPLASWAGKRSQVLARHARFNRRQPHRRTTSGALRTLILCVEHGLPLRNQYLTGRPGFAREPTSRFGFEGVRCNDTDLNAIAPGAFEQPLLEANWTRQNALQHHFGLAMRTTEALNRGQGLCG